MGCGLGIGLLKSPQMILLTLTAIKHFQGPVLWGQGRGGSLQGKRRLILLNQLVFLPRVGLGYSVYPFIPGAKVVQHLSNEDDTVSSYVVYVRSLTPPPPPSFTCLPSAL